jgi:transposase
VDEVEESDRMVERVAAIDVAKAELTVCVRVPAGASGRRRQEVRAYQATTSAILQMADWLHAQEVTLVVMEATGDYWKPPFYLLKVFLDQVCGMVRPVWARNDHSRAGLRRIRPRARRAARCRSTRSVAA